MNRSDKCTAALMDMHEWVNMLAEAKSDGVEELCLAGIRCAVERYETWRDMEKIKALREKAA